MTPAELEIIDLLAQAYNKFITLDATSPHDRHEFMTAIHVNQHIVMKRLAQRSHPDIFRTS